MPEPRAASRKPSLVVGWREWVALPELGFHRLRAKIDSGARTSALHATNISVRRSGDETIVDFHVPTETGEVRQCSAVLVDQRLIKNTGGIKERRLVIRTMLTIAGRRWPIDVSLTDRQAMKFDFILGRTAIRRHAILIDPGRSFLAGDPFRSRTA